MARKRYMPPVGSGWRKKGQNGTYISLELVNLLGQPIRLLVFRNTNDEVGVDYDVRLVPQDEGTDDGDDLLDDEEEEDDDEEAEDGE